MGTNAQLYFTQIITANASKTVQWTMTHAIMKMKHHMRESLRTAKFLHDSPESVALHCIGGVRQVDEGSVEDDEDVGEEEEGEEEEEEQVSYESSRKEDAVVVAAAESMGPSTQSHAAWFFSMRTLKSQRTTSLSASSIVTERV
ncbi:hypothetical protein SprV_0100107000 [Sparganum proliferum]